MPHARLAWLAAAILAGVDLSARAAPLPGPVCGRREVLGIVADDIARRGVDAVIVPGDVGEAPAAIPDMVRCSVRLQTVFYDTDRYGYVPQVRLSILDFTVRAGRNGLFVDAIGTPR